ncbi:MAG: AIR synthase-related protein [Bacteroidetes bacterium]|nr:AIR synthase-related protein [Bacteroidota bacterium]MCL6101751.1 AIR synthase-related protein [Bacteroidota bacterium]
MSENSPKPFTIDQIAEPEDLQSVIYSMLAIPHLSPVNIFNEFAAPDLDPAQMSIDNTDDSGIFQLDDDERFYSMTIYADHRRLAVDPFTAAQILVAKAVRRLVSFGAVPVSISSFMNHVEFANPIAQEMVMAARLGLDAAAKSFNLKFSQRKLHYDYSGDEGFVPPTLIISLFGKLKSRDQLLLPRFRKKGDNLLLIGRSYNDINASEYLDFYHEVKDWPLMKFNLATESRLSEVMEEVIKNDLVISASPVGIGGLFFTLLRNALPNDLGFDITTDAEIRSDAFLFGESMGRYLVTVSKEKEDDFVDYLFDRKIPVMTLGHVTKGEIRIDDQSMGFVDKGLVSETIDDLDE